LYLITYEKNNFYINPTFEEFVDRDEFESVVVYLQQLFLYFDQSTKKYKIATDRIDEIIMWLEKDGQKYEISNACAEQLIVIQNEYKKREVKFFRDGKFDPSVLNEGVVPFNYQLDSINWSLKRSRVLDSHDAGLGKTIINICVFSTLYKQGLIDGIIIIVPIGMGFHWQCQILEFVNQFQDSDIQIIDNQLKIQPFEKFKDKKILIIRQDLLADTIASYNKGFTQKSEGKRKSLKNLKWKTADYVDIKKLWKKENIFLLVDEAHGMKHSSSIKTKALHSIKKYFDYRYLLTATPAINGMEDLYSNLSFLDQGIIPMGEQAFKIWISNSLGNKWDKYAINSYNTENVQKLMQSYQQVFIQKRKEDIPEIKTKKIFNRIEIPLTTIQKRIYELVVEEELSILQQEYEEISWRVLLQKLHLLLEVFDNPELLKKRTYSSEELMNLVSKWKMVNDNKFIALKSRVEDIIENQNSKVIIYDIHPQTIDSLAEQFKSYNPLVIHGGLKVKDINIDRKEKQDLFNFDKKHKLMILSMYTSSQGINLQHGGNHILFNTLSWDATLFEQAQNRTDRATSKKDSLIELFYYPRTLDSLRLNNNLNRIELNSKMDKNLTQQDLQRLLQGEI